MRCFDLTGLESKSSLFYVVTLHSIRGDFRESLVFECSIVAIVSRAQFVLSTAINVSLIVILKVLGVCAGSDPSSDDDAMQYRQQGHLKHNQ